jgi:RsiW-degrading membrane proteinase PrsW (M82 family)|tara:strand:+ start:1139 stop:1312 length:174 start_codon:yes stop_codon:yes gene_type:complete
MKNISNIGDIIAIPFFLLLFIYFYKKKNKSNIEKLLLLFASGGFLADIYFTYNHFNQ